LLGTLGEKGMAVFEKDAGPVYVPTRARKVRDVSGAGDTVISTLTMAYISGATFLEAATIGNRAAGLVCEEVGIVPVNRDKLLDVLLEEVLEWER
jgi:bifunctional ADP-heptose synthase (sugar kinase/adenylyltransferase)